MNTLIEVIFELFGKIIRGIIDLIGILFMGIPLPNFSTKEKYSAKFMSFWQRIRILNTWNYGVSLNGYQQISSKSSCENCLIVGGSGSGKSSVVGISSVLRLNKSFLIIDVDGSAYKKTSGDARSRGFDIKTIDLINPEFSEQFEPLRNCKTDSDLNGLAEALIFTQYSQSSSGDSSFWNFGAQSVLYIVLRLIKLQDLQFQNLTNARHLLQRFALLESFIVEQSTPNIFNDYLAFSAGDEKVKAGFIQTALMALEKFADPILSHVTATGGLDFTDFTKKKSAWYIIVPEARLKYYQPFLSIFFSTLFEFIQLNPPKKTVYMLLDEFGNLKIKDFPMIASTMRKYNVSLSLMVQDVKQISAHYGADGLATIFSGSCAHKIIFPGMSLELARNLVESFGRKHFEQSTNKYTASSDSRELITIQELIQMKSNKGLYIYRNKPPHITTMKPFYKQFFLYQRTKKRPFRRNENAVQSPQLLPTPNQNRSL